MALDITTARLDIAKLYVAAFDRAPDVSGLDFWVNAYVSGKDTLSTIAQKFTNSDEYKAKYPSYLSNEQIVEKVYVNVFDRASDAEGKTFWVNALTSGALTTGTLMKAMVDAATKNGGTDNANLTAQAQAGVDAAIVAASTVTLTSGNDNFTGMLFEAPQTYTPGGTNRINSLQDNDKLTGTSTMDALNVTIGHNADTGDTNIMPILTGVDTVNVSFDATGYSLDMQDSTGTTTEVNVKRMEAGATNAVNNMADLAAKYSVTSSETAADSLTFDLLDSAVSGTSDATILALNKANVDSLVLQASASNGVETINMQSNVSSNVIGLLTAEDLKTLNISGSQALRIGATSNITNGALIEGTRYTAGLANVAGSLTAIDASTMTGALTLVMGAELNAVLEGTTGTAVSMAVTGGTAADTFVLAQGASINAVTGNTDVISGGEGTDKLILLGADVVGVVGQTVAAATTANVKSVEALEIRAGHDSVANNAAEAADAVTVDADAFDALATIYVRNEGSGDTDITAAVVIGSKAEAMTVNLNDLTAAQAAAITVAHGTTGNSTIANNIVNVALKTATAITDAASFTIVDGLNTDAVFNARLTATAIERVTIADNDTESNTIHLLSGITSATTAANNAGSSTTLTGGVAGQYMNLDSTPGLAGIAAAAGTVGYGYATDGTAGSATTANAALAAIAGVAATVSTSARDNAVASVFNGNGATALNQIFTETINASAYAGDVIVRLGDITRVDGVTSQTITTSTGNDTFIFDNVQAANAGFTSADTVAASTGTDTLILDGDTSLVAGTPVIAHAASEWDKLTGIDVMRFGTNTAGYSVELDNELIDQTDSTSRLTIVNNDGILSTDSESTLTVDARALNQTNFITFVGANGVGTKAGVNTIQLSDVSANGSQILNGGDTDVRASTTAGYVANNNNVYNVWNTANVSINDLAQTSNFRTITFNNDQAVAQTLTLTLNNTVVEAMVDASNTATTVGTQEILVVTATDATAVATAALNINASAVTGFHSLNVTGSAAANDTVYLDANVGGSVHTIALGASTGDTVNWTGGSATMTVAATALGNAAFTAGATTTTHVLTGNDNMNLSNLTYASSVLTDAAAVNTYVLGTVAAVDTLVFAANAGGAAPSATVFDTVTNFASASDKIDFGATAIVIGDQGTAAAAGVATIAAAGTATFNAADTTLAQHLAAVAAAIVTGGVTVAGETVVWQEGADAYLFISDAVNGVSANDTLIKLTGVNTALAAFDTITVVAGDMTLA